VLERWIADRPFREACGPGQSDLDVARGTHAREILQDHWRNWIVESDWAWLAQTGINTVRIPVSLMDPVNPVPTPSPYPSAGALAFFRLAPDAKRSKPLCVCAYEPPRVSRPTAAVVSAHTGS